MPDDVFEIYADDYDRWFDEHSHEYLAELSRIRQFFLEPGILSIEVGCGSGRYASPLGIKIGVEPSLSLCRIAKRRGIDVVRGRAEALPLKSDVCPAVLLVTVICFLDSPMPALRELFRILIPDGNLVVAFIEYGGEIHRKYLNEGGKGRFLKTARFYSQEEVCSFLKRAGFGLENIDSKRGFCVIAAQKSDTAR